MNRIESSAKSAVSSLMAVAFLFVVVACSNNRSGLNISPVQHVRPNSTPGASCVTRGASSFVSEFLGHTHGGTFIPNEDIVAGLEKTYATPLTDGHAHGFVVTHLMFEDLQDNVPVTTSTYPDASGHGHQISIFCY